MIEELVERRTETEIHALDEERRGVKASVRGVARREKALRRDSDRLDALERKLERRERDLTAMSRRIEERSREPDDREANLERIRSE